VGAAATFQRICDAIEAAQHSVWLTVAFISPDFQMPDRRGSVFDVLDDAVKRGLDVRVIFWRPNPQSAGFGSTFSGLPADRELLRKRNSHFRARWDRTHDAYCHHQKSWLIDAGEPSETAFIGGINLTSKDPPWHDIYVEVTGPSATDVHHSFVQRWNEASERTSEDGLWGHTGDDTLTFPTRLSRSRGESIVQIQRTVHAGCYSDGRPSPGGPSHEVVDGEQTIFEQYLQAIDAAQHSIYIENQAIPIPEIATRLEDALKRGVDVVVLVPADADGYVRSSRTKPERRLLFDKFEALGRHRNFALVGLARRTHKEVGATYMSMGRLC